MASILREIALNQSVDRVWDALRDFHAVDRRVAPGFITRSEPDGTARIITFANGSTAKEELVDCDDTARRLVYAISNERLKHYNAAVQVFADGAVHCRLVWTVDVLPNDLAAYVGQQMDAAVKVMKPTLERTSP
ncbi:MAG: SRPBCC family protein [Steroidobacteraceae bacterium]